MTDELNGRLEDDVSFHLEEDPAPTTEAVETFTLSDEEMEHEVEADPDAHRKPKSAHHSSGWVQGPGMVELLAEASRLLVKATDLKGQLNQQLPWVRVTALEGKRCLLVRPTKSADTKKRPVTWRKGHAHFVASDVLIDALIDMREPLATTILPKPKGKSTKGA